ncbi:MAG: RHS repeat protein [Ruminococcaceae bacterium]|nr:RHS repeat protein [Oscillospiraceae bacterium]
MKQKSYKPRITKRIISLTLSLILAFGTFVSMTVDNFLLSDYIDLREKIVAKASLNPVPIFYRYGELVGLYRENYSDTTTLKYSFDGNTWFDYSMPFTIPAHQTTTVYAKIGNKGTEIYNNFSNTDKAIGVYTDYSTDFDFSYNGIDFGYTRIYNSADKNWFESIHSKIATAGSYLKVTLPDGSETPFIRTAANTYVDQITGKTVTKTSSEYLYDDGEYKYHFAIRLLNSIAYLSAIEDYNGNTLNLTRTTNSDEISITDGSRTFAVSDYEAVEAVNDPDVQYYSVKTITDPNNNDIEYTTKWGRYIQVKDQSGAYLGKYQYVNNASDFRMTKSNDKSIEYYSNGRLKKITYDNGSWIQYTYTDNQKLYTTLTSSGETTSTVYNDAFLPVSYTDEYGTTTAYTYDSKFRVATETVGNEVTSYTYNSNSGLLESMTVTGGDENYSASYTYDNNKRLIHEQYDDSHQYYTYDNNGNILIYATLKEGFEGTAPSVYDNTLTCFDTISYTYDSSGRVLSETLSNGESYSYVYDTAGNITQETYTKIENNEPVSTVTTYTYDSLGNLLTSATGNDNSSYIYDAAGKTLLSNENGEITRTLYDNLGRVVQEIEPKDYDETLEGLPSENTYSDSTAGHTYIYDSTTGNLTSETNRLGVETTYTYHPTGEKATESFDIYEFDYNVKGMETAVKIANVTTVSNTYQNDGVTLTATVYANGDSIRYVYDDVSGNLQYQYHNNSSTPYLTYIYDNGELEQKINTDTGLKYIYDGEDYEVRKISDNSLVYSYSATEIEEDEANQIEAETDISENHFGTAYSTVIKNNSITHSTGNNEIEYSYEEGEDYNITEDSLKFNNSVSGSSEYEYDENGNISEKSVEYTDYSGCFTYDILEEYNSSNQIIRYGYSGYDNDYYYDSNGQITRANINYYPTHTATYAYDSRGNVTSKIKYKFTRNTPINTTQKTNTSFTYAQSGWTDILVSVNNDSLTYDANGNVLTFGNRSFTWSAGRNLASVTEGDDSYSYTYDENGIRTSKTVNGVTTQFNTRDGVILSQTDGTNTMVFEYDNFGAPIGVVFNGTQYLYITNQQNDVMAVTDEDGLELFQYEYDEWGGVHSIDYTNTNDTNPEHLLLSQINPILYRGYYYDYETGYYYLQSRYYDPSICRFINADIPEIAQYCKDEVNGLNLFAYCCNDPVNNEDPTGSKKKLSDKAKKKIENALKDLAKNIDKLNKLISRFKTDYKYLYIFIEKKEVKKVILNLQSSADIIGIIAAIGGAGIAIGLALLPVTDGGSVVPTIVDAVFTGTCGVICGYINLMATRLERHNNGKDLVIRVKKRGFGKFTFKIIEGWDKV